MSLVQTHSVVSIESIAKQRLEWVSVSYLNFNVNHLCVRPAHDLWSGSAASTVQIIFCRENYKNIPTIYQANVHHFQIPYMCHLT